MSGQLYTTAASYMHWAVGFPLIASIGAVLKAQEAPKEEKGTWMFRHKSMGLLTGILVAPRLAYRLVNAAKFSSVPHLPGSGPIEMKLADVSHIALYSFMGIMPATGIAMGYFGGKGLPFFTTTIPGAKETNPEIAKKAFSIHKQVGVYGKYLVPLHVGAAFGHYFRGQAIFGRINPFRGGPKH
mmetsp:Transcript_49796/g.149797  ORF Transcript_49796/g.149797 Transcript_49796/m.149797 type:complete len:184 (-) Transcript_49796:412-963(-)